MTTSEVLSVAPNFQSLSVKDLLEARDLYHWHLLNKANVVGTAIGLYLIRTSDPWPTSHESDHRINSHTQHKSERTFANSGVRSYSWPCVIVTVKQWIDESDIGADGALHPQDTVPKTLYLPDGRMVPVCVVKITPCEPTPAMGSGPRFPETYIGGGFPLTVDVQGRRHLASVGCLVSDGHKTYALTNRHVCGDEGEPIYAHLRGNLVEIGRASLRQLTRRQFSEVYPEFPGKRSFLNLDIGLVEVNDVNDWSSQIYSFSEPVGELADLNEGNISLRLIDQKVTGFGAVSGRINGTIKALFHRYKSVGGYDYVADFLIAPAEDGVTQTHPGDSGTIWHLKVPVAKEAAATSGPTVVRSAKSIVRGKDKAIKVRPQATSAFTLRPLAIEWGGQAFADSGVGKTSNFSLATSLSNVCKLLDVELVHDHNTGAQPYWGQVGHYSIATFAIDSLADGKLKTLLKNNLSSISFAPEKLDAAAIKAAIAEGGFVELADVPDIVWKKVKGSVPGGRDVRTNTGPEHPTHYADVDEPGPEDGPTLLEISMKDPSKVDIEFWRKHYDSLGHKQSRERGLLPFRVWQFFDAMIDFLKNDKIKEFVCAAGIVSHYVGDACQPLHGSYHSDGFREQQKAGDKSWPGRGVHSTYEDNMIDRFSPALLEKIRDVTKSRKPKLSAIGDGQNAAVSIVKLMSVSQKILPPDDIVDEYIRLGGGKSRPVLEGLWNSFGDQTAELMAEGARYLANIWQSAWDAGNGDRKKIADLVEIDQSTLAKIYQKETFVPSLDLDNIGDTLK